ncbi:MAG: ASCH domain-containing protein, partial [Cyanobacteria bacterium SBLK]|nr:ASCH domain-containing protein [Cyanobacteria bacterium SBLK]
MAAKAISLWQPWASLIAMGRKKFETRHWSTDYRG